MRSNEGNTGVYSYIWEFRVKTGKEVEFEKVYGPDGDWVCLFSKADGYLRTELHRDLEIQGRYITVDYWTSRAAFQAFRARFAPEFDELDTRCEALTEAETFLGSFNWIAPSA